MGNDGHGEPAAPRVTKESLQLLCEERVPLTGLMGMVVESVEAGRVVVRAPVRDEFVRPGGTVAGPVLMALADFAVYGVVLSLLGPVELAVTTHLGINFLRRPALADVVAEGRILKLGQRLAVGEVSLYSVGQSDMVAHATCTYSIPPRTL